MLPLLDILQHLKAIFSRHMEVEEQQIGDRLFEGGDGLVAIVDGVEMMGQPGSLEADLNELGGRSIILGEENAGRRAGWVCNHLKSLAHPRLQPQFVFTNLGPSRERVWGTAYCSMNIA